MAKLNVTDHRRTYTHEGAPAKRITPEQELERSVLACMLWEKTFYESGEDIATRIRSLVPKCPISFVSDLAIKARLGMHLRHVPLLLTYSLTEHPRIGDNPFVVRKTLHGIIQRPDELGEFIAMYRQFATSRTLTRQVKKGLADAIRGFDEFALVKWDQTNAAVKLRDVIFLTHAKPQSLEQGRLWASIVNKTYYPEKTKSGFNLKQAYGLEGSVTHPESPDTWEVNLSAGGKDADKKAIWMRLLEERKLGGLALLCNLRNMDEAKVPHEAIFTAIQQNQFRYVLPFRFIAAARYAPWAEPVLEEAFIRVMAQGKKWHGLTVLLVDVSGSMDGKLSAKSDMTRMDAACGLAMVLREIAGQLRVYSFSSGLAEVPARQGFALRDAIVNSQNHGGTYLGQAVQALHQLHSEYDRLIVITDEQSHDRVADPTGNAYMLNVASYKNGVGYGSWMHIDGFSESVVKYMMTVESSAEVLA